MKKIALLFLILLIGVMLFSETDSEHTELLDQLLQKAKSEMNEDPGISVQYAEAGVTYCKKNNLPEYEAEFHLVLGQVYKTLKMEDKLLKSYKDALIIYSKLKDISGKILVINKIAEYNYNIFHLDEAADLYERSLKLCKQINDKTGEMHAAFALAIIYYEVDDYKKAYKYLETATQVDDKLKEMMGNNSPRKEDILNKKQLKLLSELLQKKKLDEATQKAKYVKKEKPKVKIVRDEKKEKELEQKLKESEGNIKAKETEVNSLMSTLSKKENELLEHYVAERVNEGRIKSLRSRNFLLILFLVIVVVNMVLIIRSYLGKVRSNNELLKAHEVIKSKNFELTKAYDQIERISRIDPLTKVFNRRDMEEKMLDAVNLFEREMNPFSFLLLDIDFFKKTNDTYGHDAGDYVLKTLAALLRATFRKIDNISRWGGEEFLILLNKTGEEGARVAAEKIRQAVKDFKFEYNDISFNITISVGYSTYNELREVHEVIKEADIALYKAKQNGRNQCVKFEDQE